MKIDNEEIIDNEVAKESLLTKIVNKVIPDSSKHYDLLKPYGVESFIKQSYNESNEAYSRLSQMIDLNDEVFKRLSELAFKSDDESNMLISIIPRHKVSTEMHKEIVEIDAMIWITDELNSIQKYFIAYELSGLIEIVPIYDEERDNVIFKMQTVHALDINECSELLPYSNFITKMWYVLAITTTISISSIITIITYLLS